jgi:small subunit ribosomal protein S14
MARTAIKVKTERKQKEVAKAIAEGKKPNKPTKAYHRCKACGRVGGYMRKFEVCRICFRELARDGKIMGIKKSSW